MVLTKAQCNTNLCEWCLGYLAQFAGRHRWHFLVDCQVVSFLPWETMCPIKGGGGGGGGPLRQCGWSASGRMNHVYPILSTPISPPIWAGEVGHKTKALDCRSGIYHELRGHVVNPSNQWAIFHQYLSVVLNCCFGLTVIPHVSVLLSMSHWTEITKLQINFGWISLQIRYFFFLAAGIYCKYISLNTSYLLTLNFVPAISVKCAEFTWTHLVTQSSLQQTWWKQVMANCLQDFFFTATSLSVSYEGKSLEKYHASLVLYAQPQRCIVTNTPDLSLPTVETNACIRPPLLSKKRQPGVWWKWTSRQIDGWLKAAGMALEPALLCFQTSLSPVWMEPLSLSTKSKCRTCKIWCIL